MQALGYGSPGGLPVVDLIQTDDPDELGSALARAPLGRPAPNPASFMPRGEKRGVLEFSLRELHLASPRPVDLIPLATGAPFGGLDINVAGCTLCLSCVSVCPTHALSDNAERPMLRFSESLCVQCGLCAATCPEHVIALKPQLDFAAWKALGLTPSPLCPDNEFLRRAFIDLIGRIAQPGIGRTSRALAEKPPVDVTETCAAVAAATIDTDLVRLVADFSKGAENSKLRVALHGAEVNSGQRLLLFPP